MTCLTRRALLPSVLAAAMMITQSVQAQPDSDLDDPLTALYAGLEAAMRAGRAAPFAQRFDALAPAVDRAFDLETILKVSVGLRWDAIEPPAQSRQYARHCA